MSRLQRAIRHPANQQTLRPALSLVKPPAGPSNSGALAKALGRDEFVGPVGVEASSARPQLESKPVVRRASTPEELERCRNLVYRFYAQKGYLQSDPVVAHQAGTFHADQTHASPAARRRGQTHFVESSQGEILATGTLLRDTPGHVSKQADNYGLPLDKAVPRELATLRAELGAGRVVGELGGLASTGSSRSGGLSGAHFIKALRRGELPAEPLLVLMMRLQEHAAAQGITDLVVGVNPTHAQFYQRLGFREVQPSQGEARPDYAGLRNAEVVLLHARTQDVGPAALKERFARGGPG